MESAMRYVLPLWTCRWYGEVCDQEMEQIMGKRGEGMTVYHSIVINEHDVFHRITTDVVKAENMEYTFVARITMQHHSVTSMGMFTL